MVMTKTQSSQNVRRKKTQTSTLQLNYKEHIVIILLFIFVAFLAGKSGSIADNIGFSLLEKTNAPFDAPHHSTWWDITNEYLPRYRIVWLSDALVGLQISIGVLNIFFGVQRAEQLLQRTSSFCKIYGTILLLRTLSVLSTVHSISPVVAERIESGESLLSIRHSIGLIANTNCFDMMFSGHVSTIVVIALFVYVSPSPRIMKFPAIILALISPYCIVMVGDHYTSDVIIAVYTTILVFLVYKPTFI